VFVTTSWFVDEDDGSVTLVVLRREEGGPPSGAELEFKGADTRRALAAYDRFCRKQNKRHIRAAEARRRWGFGQ
jgi:hypothetical protein